MDGVVRLMGACAGAPPAALDRLDGRTPLSRKMSLTTEVLTSVGAEINHLYSLFTSCSCLPNGS